MAALSKPSRGHFKLIRSSRISPQSVHTSFQECYATSMYFYQSFPASKFIRVNDPTVRILKDVCLRYQWQNLRVAHYDTDVPTWVTYLVFLRHNPICLFFWTIKNADQKNVFEFWRFDHDVIKIYYIHV